MRRNFIQKALLGFIAMTGIGNKAAFANTNKKNTPGKFAHIVFFWLKSPENEAVKQQFLKSLNSFLEEVETIRTHHVGPPANTSRPVIDSTYTYCLVVTFDDKEAHDIYQEHASHKRFIAESQALWSKVQVYDSVDMA